jgi:hypothetical protein
MCDASCLAATFADDRCILIMPEHCSGHLQQQQLAHHPEPQRFVVKVDSDRVTAEALNGIGTHLMLW